MNFTIAGIKGYEYQYKATVFIALHVGFDRVVSLLVEEIGKEDATIKIINNAYLEVEIQVKRENSTLDIEKLEDWLTHFQGEASNNNLLYRIQNDVNKMALFITNSRCHTDTVFLKRRPPIIPTDSNISVSKNWNDRFIKALESYSDKTTKLLIPRKAFCSAQAKTFKERKVTAKTLERVIIWEEVADETLDLGVTSTLNKLYNIPQSQTDVVYLRLLEIVKKGRDEGIDILPVFGKLINRERAGAPVLDSNYKKRLEEDLLFAELEANNVLLLTGITLCGKSELAKQIAFRLFNKGFNYLISTDFQIISNFFAQNQLEDKVAVFEDPWGHLEKSAESLSEWKRIEHFIANLPPNHKILITSRREIIKEISSSYELNRKKLKGRDWHDLTLTDTNFLLLYWKEIAEIKGLSNEVIQQIEEHLGSAYEEEKLQIGQLQFLAGFDEVDLLEKTTSELEHIARMNSQEIAESIRDKNQRLAELMALLALTATTNTGVSKTELAYILSDDEKMYSIVDKKMWTSHWGQGEAQYPKYDSQHLLSDEVVGSLEYLQRRFFVSDKAGYIFFSHPNYFEAGRYLFSEPSKTGQERFLKKVRKALFVINPNTSFLVANQFSFLANKLPKTFFPELFQIAFKGLNSIFPAVEDSLLVFLIEFMNELDDEKKQKLVSKLDSDGSPTSHIFWHDESIPFINTDSGRVLEDYFFTLEADEVFSIETALERKDAVPSQKVWQYLLSLRNTVDKKLSTIILDALLQYKEVFIRRRAAFNFVWRAEATVKYEDLNKIFSDPHPSVVFDGIRACFMSWQYFPMDIRERLTKKIEELFSRSVIAIRANRFMTTFAKEHEGHSLNWSNMSEDEKKQLWNLWGKVYPTFSAQLPAVVHLNPGRFGRTMEESLKYLAPETGLQVLQAWYDRIDYRIKKGRTPDEYEMAVAKDLMSFTKDNHTSRSVLFERLISYPETSFLLSNIKWIVDDWHYLHETEKDRIISLSQSNREDVRWIKAVLLNTHQNPPEQVQQTILGDGNFFDKATGYIVQNFPEGLLTDCLHVHFGHPQPLWWLAVHHHNTTFWGRIIRFILYKKKKPFFSLCIRELLFDGVNSFSRNWADGLKVWRTLCRRPGAKIEMAKRLILQTASSSCAIDDTRKLWKYIIKAFQREGRENEFVELVVTYIEVLQQTGDKKDIFKILGKDFVFNKICPKIYPDHIIISLLEQTLNYPLLEDSFLQILDSLVSNNGSIRFYYTSSFLDYAIGKYPMSENLKTKLNSLPRNHEEIGEEKMLILEKELEEDILPENWIRFDK